MSNRQITTYKLYTFLIGENNMFKYKKSHDNLEELMKSCTYVLNHNPKYKKSQIRILNLLSDHGEIVQKDLRNILNVKSGSMSEIISKLEKMNFIEKIKDVTDRRNVILKITNRGIQFLQESKRFEQHISFSTLSIDEQETLKNILLKLRRSFS